MLTLTVITMFVLLMLGFPMMVPLLVASLMLLFLVIDMGNVGLLMGQMISGVEVGQVVLRRAAHHCEPFSNFERLLVFAFTFCLRVCLEHRAAD